jgi:hypothetical protein
MWKRNASPSSNNPWNLGPIVIAGTTSVAAPVINSSLTASASFKVAASTYTITASNTPTSFNATGLPAGLSVNTTTGDITGTPTQVGTFNVTLTATNTGGTDTKTLVYTVAPTIPAAPTVGTATAGNTQATVSFTAPSNNGGASITSYTVTSSPSGLTASGSASPITVAGLTNGTAYTFSVIATNSVGKSVASAASNAATPATLPNAPTSVIATAGNAQASVAFTAPASNGGASITSYTVIASPSGITTSGASSPIVVTGLTNGTAYTFSVTATNNIGTSSASTASSAVTPFTVPDAPQNATATSGNATATVSFDVFSLEGIEVTGSNSKTVLI